MYGGFGISTAIVLTIAAVDIGSVRVGACLAVAAALAGMAFGRLVSALVDEPTPSEPTEAGSSGGRTAGNIRTAPP